mgnify:CR=1 FL=1
MNLNTHNCTGCGACVQKCPCACLKMVPNQEGFLYPICDISRCSDCGLCMQICPANHEVSVQTYKQEAYALINKNNDILRESASGGAFPAAAKWILDRNGVVFGCALDESMRPVHKQITSAKELRQLQGSKYVQSEIGDSYKQVLEYLTKDVPVLFSGTPCQIESLYAFLGNSNIKNLYTMDLICHGVTSPQFFLEYILWLGKKLDSRICDYRFRDKAKYPWGDKYCAAISTTDGRQIYRTFDQDPYYSAFFYGENYRECCYSCKYACLNRVGDISIGDFWGYSEQLPMLKETSQKGLSLVICNTEQGKILLEQMAGQTQIIPCNLTLAAEKNDNLMRPSYSPECRKTFYSTVQKNGFDAYAASFYKSKRYFFNRFKSLIPSGIKQLIPKSAKSTLNNLFKR